MAWHCVTHTTGGLADGVEAPTAARRLQRVWAPVVLIWRGSTTAIRPMTWGGDERRTAESAAQRLHNSGWWRGINRDERDATARPQAVSRTDSSVSTRQTVAVASSLRSPLQQTPRHSLERSRPSRIPRATLGNSTSWAARQGFCVIRFRAPLPSD